ncbi:uncharacterized protein LOC123865691 isoform X2 [Maniola jurtina]|uniref:uncharacterized protein LOC123865691 isoform X2 n=1 Tax=Maniola jurtina TaxID=191418 RepID=UPI001E687BEA|nr:uncharacterized protein LOC123865691 isoform X2 [Maniola jurtina]
MENSQACSCKEWVRVTGEEDLAYIPIEKLNTLKFVCEGHFKYKDFCRKKTKLKKKAIPSLNLTSKPLGDDILADFPLHMWKSNTPEKKSQEEHNYFEKIQPTSRCGSTPLETGHERGSPTLDTGCENGSATSNAAPTQEKLSSPSEPMQNPPHVIWDYSGGILQLIMFPVEPGCVIKFGAQGQ